MLNELFTGIWLIWIFTCATIKLSKKKPKNWPLSHSVYGQFFLPFNSGDRLISEQCSEKGSLSTLKKIIKLFFLYHIKFRSSFLMYQVYLVIMEAICILIWLFLWWFWIAVEAFFIRYYSWIDKTPFKCLDARCF